MSVGAFEQLVQRTTGVRAALERDDRALAEQRLAALERETTAFAQAGEVSEVHAARILVAIAQLDELLTSREPAVANPEPEPISTPEEDLVEYGDDDDEEEISRPSRSKGKGKGHKHKWKYEDESEGEDD